MIVSPKISGKTLDQRTQHTSGPITDSSFPRSHQTANQEAHNISEAQVNPAILHQSKDETLNLEKKIIVQPAALKSPKRHKNTLDHSQITSRSPLLLNGSFRIGTDFMNVEGMTKSPLNGHSMTPVSYKADNHRQSIEHKKSRQTPVTFMQTDETHSISPSAMKKNNPYLHCKFLSLWTHSAEGEGGPRLQRVMPAWSAAKRTLWRFSRQI